MCNKISDMILGLATPAHMKLQLIPVLQHMHHDTSTAAMVLLNFLLIIKSISFFQLIFISKLA